jgi:hypothetical protein
MSGDTSSPTESECESDDTFEEFDVEVIRKWRYNRKTKSREFFIKWRGYPEEENTWEPESHLNCPEPMEAFRRSLSKRELAYFNAKNPDDLTGLQRNANIKSIGSDASSIPPLVTASTSKAKPRKENCKFVLMIVFDDGEKQAEEVTIDDLFRHQPERAFEWIEQRLIFESALKNRPDVL